jgi:DNA repair exonuclease SbcCD nuclease subunit
MILVFSDTHLGIKTHSVIEPDGLSTAEHDARIALNQIYTRAKEDDIELVIFCGDMFHTSHPTTKNIEFFIDWIQRMNDLGKPICLIVGNHDVSAYSHSMVFLCEMPLRNVTLVATSLCAFQGGGGLLHCVPYLPFETGKDKSGPTFQALSACFSACTNNSIIIAHVYDSDVKIGSESTMISRFTETIDFDKFQGAKNILLLLGHAHKQQMYDKKNGMKVVCPGSLFYHDLSDVDQNKGYALVDIVNNEYRVTFEKIEGIREFVSYSVSEGEDALDFFNAFRMSPNKLVFVKSTSRKKYDENKLRELLKSKGCILDSVRYNTTTKKENEIIISFTTLDKYALFREDASLRLQKRGEPQNLDMILSRGNKYLEEAGMVKNK